MNLLLTALAAAVPVLVIKGILTLRRKRLVQYRDIPQMKTSVMWGHLAAIGEEMKKVAKDAQWGMFSFLFSFSLSLCLSVALIGDYVGFTMPSSLLSLILHM